MNHPPAGKSSSTNMRGAKITGSSIAAGTDARAYLVIGAAPEHLETLIAEVRARLSALEDDPEHAVTAASLEGVVSQIEREIAAPQPRRQRLVALLRGLAVSSDLVTLSGPTAALAAAVAAHFNL